ncbi:MAG: biotin/lipoyl-containing protein [Saprospiraceae bacterium]
MKEGDEVQKNTLFIIEAMKMESTITSNIAGKVQKASSENFGGAR